MVGARGFEPPTSCVRGRPSSRLTIRTDMEPLLGLEPSTYSNPPSPPGLAEIGR